MGTMIELQSADGHNFAAYKSTPGPSEKIRGGVVVLQEIFGVNKHIRAVADGYAADGYVAIAPAMYDRVQRGYETGYTQPEIDAGVVIMQKLDLAQTMHEIDAAVAEAGKAGKVAIIGYCWGGTMSWVASARNQKLAAAVAYYPGGIAGFAGESPRCPVMCHFGEKDKSPTPEVAKGVLDEHPAEVAFFYPAGHGFNCDHRASFDADAAKLARGRTLKFLRKYLG